VIINSARNDTKLNKVLLSSGKNDYPAIDELKADPTLAKITQVQRVNYLNNILEQGIDSSND